MKKLLITLTTFSLLFGSCKKEETPVNKSKTDLLCAHYWKLASATVNPPLDIDGVPVTDIFATFDDCQKDDLTKYNTDKTVIYDEGATKCDPSASQTTSGTWSFNSDETILTENGDSGNIAELNESSLIVKAVENIDGVNYTFTARYQKK